MLISEVRKDGSLVDGRVPHSLCQCIAPDLSQPRGCPQGDRTSSRLLKSVPQDSRFEVSKNGTLRINSVEVYDGTLYRCVSSTPAGSIEAQARVQVLGELANVLCWRILSLCRQGGDRDGPASFFLFQLFLLSFPTNPEKLKFTPPPQPQQCMEFDKEATVPCSATGREKPTVKWVRAGEYHVTQALERARGTGECPACTWNCWEKPEMTD